MNSNHLVTQSNNLIEARQKHPLNAREQKIVLTFVSMIQPDDEDFQKYEMYIREFHEMLGLEGREHYTQIKEIVKNLMSKVIEIPYPNGDYLMANWASSVKYKSGEGKIEFAFSPDLRPYLLQLKRAFTSYRLSNILSLRSVYSIRLYELMKKWQHLGNWECPIDMLKERLGISKDKYKQYGHFKNRVITPSVKELNEKTDVTISFKEIREGRKVSKIEFNIRHCKKKEIKVSLPNDPSEDEPKRPKFDKDLFDRLNELTDGYELSLAGFKRIESIAKDIYTKEEYIGQLERLIEFINVENRLGNIDKPVGFMIHFIEEKEKMYKEGYNPKIENTSTEVVPDWFKDRNKPKEKVEKTKEQLEEEEKDRREMDAILAKYRKKDPETVG